MENLTNMLKKGKDAVTGSVSGLRDQATKAQSSFGAHGSMIGKFVFIIFNVPSELVII